MIREFLNFRLKLYINHILYYNRSVVLFIPQNGIHFLDSAIIRLSHEIRHKIIIQCLLVRIWIIHTITILAQDVKSA